MPRAVPAMIVVVLLSGCAGSSTGPAPRGGSAADEVSVACKSARMRFQTLCSSPGLPSNVVTVSPGCLAANDDVHRYCD